MLELKKKIFSIMKKIYNWYLILNIGNANIKLQNDDMDKDVIITIKSFKCFFEFKFLDQC